jgi:hypothetical protein
MPLETSTGTTVRRESVTFMRWPDVPGVEIFEREVEWVRSVRARNRLVKHDRKGQQRSRDLTLFDGRLCPDPVAQAVEIADETARRQCCGPRRVFPEMEIQTFAEATETPYLIEADGTRSTVPEDWFLHDDAACDLWVLACSQNRRIESPARRPGPVVVAEDVVWSTHRDDAANERRIAAFSASLVALGLVEHEPAAEGPAPGM